LTGRKFGPPEMPVMSLMLTVGSPDAYSVTLMPWIPRLVAASVP
jgi:hypothetical protein